MLVTYTGEFLDGREFDSNLGEDPLAVTIPNESFIPGWNEGLKLMRDQGDGMLIIPNDLAYGEEGLINQSGYTIIPPYMTLIFYLHTVEAP